MIEVSENQNLNETRDSSQEKGESYQIQFENWGLIAYQEALQKQLQYVEEVAEGRRKETVIFCSHPPVVTLGRATEAGDVTNWSGEIVEVSRGGRATYHGPDQFVVYPILNLNKRGRDLHKYLRWLESIVISLLNDLGVKASLREGATGVWVDDKKICSIGVAVKKWVTYHGLSLAVDENPQAYSGINPCGFTPQTMTNLERVLGQRCAVSLVELFCQKIKNGYNLTETDN